jgi:hypothetical protein
VRRGPNRVVKRCAVVFTENGGRAAAPLPQIPVRGGAQRVGGGQMAPAGW